MNYKFFFNHTALLFSFLTDISGQGSSLYFHNRKNNFLKKIDILTNQQKNLLKIFSKIYIKYYPDLSYIFYFENSGENLQKELKKLLTAQEFQQINQILANLKPVFEEIYKKERLKLVERKKKLEYISKEKKYKKILLNLFNLENKENIKENSYKVFLSLNNKSLDDCAGWYWGDNNISLEISDCPIKNLKYIFGGILLHEISHDLFKKSPIYTDFKKFCDNLKSNKSLNKIITKYELTKIDLIEEMIITSITPEGYFYRKYFGKLPTKTDVIEFEHLRKKVGMALAPTLQNYIKNNKTIDKNYFEIVVSAITS
ncbi:hypothetical protein KJ991_00580 [Patescibacteria group bacterium]|nr:hypothetical protein [Patescibacteria group bacterium]MBU4116023.1 hypothetical protein [Patescibacteria group bacterium]